MLGLLTPRLGPVCSPLALAARPRHLPDLGRPHRTDYTTRSVVRLAQASGSRLLSTTPTFLASSHDLDSTSSSASSAARGPAVKIPFLQRQAGTGKTIEYDPFAQMRAALDKKVPKSFPKILDERLADLLVGSKSKQLDPVFSSAYHPEVLEFLGDRIWDAVVAHSLVLLAARGQSAKKILGTIGLDMNQLLSNAHGAKLAEEFKLVHWSGKPCSGKGSCSSDAAADAWEAHLGALYLANGPRAVLDFLVPLVKRDFFKRSRSTSARPAARVAKLGIHPSSDIDVSPTSVIVEAPLVVADSASAPFINSPSAPVGDPLSAPLRSPPSAPVVKAPSVAAVDPVVVTDSWQRAFAAAVESSPVRRAPRKAPKGSLKKNPLVYRSHKLAVENVLPDLKERGVDYFMLKSNRVYRFQVAGEAELVAKCALQESVRIGCFVAKLVNVGLVKISKKPAKASPKKTPPA